MPSNEPICCRSLEYLSDGGRVDVTIRVWQPVPDQEQPDDLFWCRFEVTGLPETIGGNAAGIDTMQALICAMRGIRNKLQPFAMRLVFLDGPYEDSAPRHWPFARPHAREAASRAVIRSLE